MSKLYTPEMLSLATQLANYPLSGSYDKTAQARSKICGSSLSIGLDVHDGVIAGIGLKVAACAVGQSSAAILAGSAVDKSVEDITQTHNALRAWLDGEADLPQWPGLKALAGARDHTGRHDALILPWEAAILALSSVATPVQLSSDASSR